MIDVVTGHPRSGTSMMMQALASGGLMPAHDTSRDAILDRTADASYRANPDSLYEIDFAHYDDEDFPSAYDGRLIKVFWWGLSKLSSAFVYRIVVMHRDAEERRQSFAAMSAGLRRRWHATDGPVVIPLALNATVAHADYAAVVANPLGFFHGLVGRGWPIDPVKAASVVDPARYRFRRELLTVGIV